MAKLYGHFQAQKGRFSASLSETDQVADLDAWQRKYPPKKKYTRQLKFPRLHKVSLYATNDKIKKLPDSRREVVLT